ncbi:4-amino-4-deoxy-L-arabinose transferase-like glycosyltransferase [Sphingomonas vulcanisoli]|uniref:4-amino-4-deoxy-L-arabinose transferase-like glycosyltransferase n=1 Tax=Sphingomonas vulcanisoli TaxID=1658060 RepID=A0ABX0TPV0_9SPHN|nr:hypothetical protein [Sphingomonas vulcanisoli]NIJ07561.1 4-amino-4-deoxy-L-arabinose transferase-like glycosyltransferase [Sphingomonas vulcanisoli]
MKAHSVQPRWGFLLVALVIATIAFRSLYFGDPVIDADEQFYLFTGDRMLRGALPYVDIWDRKPVGLFVLFAGIRLLGSDGVLAYQLVAAGFVAATGVVIATIARWTAGPWPAIAAAIAYPLAIGWSGGMGGQSPVFYNLPMALAALILVRLIERPARFVSLGIAAMLLTGIALQIKYSAVYEGIYFGCTLLWIGWWQRIGWSRLIGAGSLWIAAALLPTLLAWLAYIGLGQGPAFVFANFTSILLRHNEPIPAQLYQLAKMLARLSPFFIALGLSERLRRRPIDAPAIHRFVLGWAAASCVGILLFGNYFNHYALPLIVPLCIATAPAFRLRPRRLALFLVALVLVANGVAYAINWRNVLHRSGDRAYAARLTQVIEANLHGGCLYVYAGEPILYYLTQSCLLTRWPFPYHLSFAREATALGVDPAAEERAILAQRPTVVVDSFDPTDVDTNRATQAVLHAALARDYRLIAAFPLKRETRLVYALKR